MHEITYIELINKLRNDIEKDLIPKEEKEKIILYINALANILWKYSA